MKFKNRIKRIADILEKMGAAGLVIWLFRENIHPSCFWVSTAFLIASILMTREDV